MVIEPSEFAEDAVENLAVAQRKQAGHVLKEKCLRLKLLKEPHRILKELVPRVRKEALRRVNGETLARRPANKDINLPLGQFELRADFRRFDVLNIAAISPCIRMV